MLLENKLQKNTSWKPLDIEANVLFGREILMPSSAAQKEIFSASLTDPDASRAYNQSISIHLEGNLQIDAIYSSLLNLLQRHEALRGSFSPDGENFRIRERVGFDLDFLNLQDLTEVERKKSYDAFVKSELDHIFDLENGPLFRSTLIQMSPKSWILNFNCHHAIVDGWSLKIILDELPKIYNTLVKNEEYAKLEESASFMKYLESVIEKENEQSDKVKKYWRELYSDGVPTLELPIDKARPSYRSYNSKREDYKIERGIYNSLKALGAKTGTSQFITLLSAFSLYLYRITGQEDHVVGVPVAGQINSGKAKLLGHDAHLLPIRCTLEKSENFERFSKRIADRFFTAYEHQRISIPGLIQELGLRREPSRIPFTPVMFNFDPGVKEENFQFEGLKSSFFFNHRNYETFEISINAVVEGADLVLECAYNSELFDSAEIHERLVQLESLFDSIAKYPELDVSKLKILTEKQIREMDLALNSTHMSYEENLCVEQLIERIVKINPKAIAVEFKDYKINYELLWEQSGKIASAILSRKLGHNPLIGIMVDRSEVMVSVLLGIWRAGGAFVPLDPSYPVDRLEYMVKNSNIRLVLTQKELFQYLSLENIVYQDIKEILESSTPPLVAMIPERSSKDLAYVIYTSGSTGNPKGVKVAHKSLNNFLTTMKTQIPGISHKDRVLGITTISFDIAELEIWLPLITGSRVVLVDRATVVDGLSLIKVIQERAISFIQATPATWRLLIYSGWEGDKNITGLCGGEALPAELASEILQRVGSLWNVYGPTEATVWSTIDRVRNGAITIGKPIGNTQTYILDEHRAWVPKGVVGELWLGGDGITEGYLGRDDLTEAVFAKNHISGSGKIYKTGDLVKLRSDGRIEYIGRNDFQVKIRGYRIEIGEVQHALAKQNAVKQCIVIWREKKAGDAHLVAYYTLKSGMIIKPAELRAGMLALIPEYMIPRYFMQISEFPLTQNGKINTKALPPAFIQGASLQHADQDFLAPRTESEIYLARLWTELLGASRVSRKDTILELGGHSLLVIQMIRRIYIEKNIRLSPKSIIIKNLEQLAAELSGDIVENSAISTPVLDIAVNDDIPLYFGTPKKQKYAYYYPADSSAEFSVLICPPLGQEYMRTHWFIRNLSNSLKKKGIPVLRFDYYAQGDSLGTTEEAKLLDYSESIIEAAEELRVHSQVSNLKVIAMRGSALLANLVAKNLGNTQIITLDAPASGNSYFEELRSVQTKRWQAFPCKKSWINNDQYEEVLGSLYSKEFLSEFSDLKMDRSHTNIISNAGWNDFTRLEQIWHSPVVIKSIHTLLFGNEQ